MKDVRNILIPKLITAIETATGKQCYTRIPKAAGVTMPYIYISDIYQEEIGSKTSYQYRLDVQIQVVYNDVDDLTNLFDDMNDILGIVNNAVPFALDSPYKIMECRLNSSTTTEFMTETGVQNIGIIRVLFDIE
jgi:hypothetical protein